MSDKYSKQGSLYVPKDADYFANSPWELRIQQADKFYHEWETRFKCKKLEEYYEGFQWKSRQDYPTTNYNPYTLNLVYSTIKIKLANLLFQKPKFLVSPSPGNMNWNQDMAVQSAQLKEDVLNTIVQNPNTNFTKHVKLAALDSFFRFGVFEIGYANDWRNPQKEIPQLKSWEDPDICEDDDKVIDSNPVSVNERIYVKRIRPSRFRTCVSEAIELNDHDWYGYYDFYYTRELMNTPGIKWPANFTSGSYVNQEYASGFIGSSSSNMDDTLMKLYSAGELSKVWHIFDNVTHKRLLLLEDVSCHELWSGDFDDNGIVDLRWDLRLSGFYPMPPVFQWISPQDEINEAREQVRSYRRRFTRKFQAIKGQVDEEEKEKFASGPDGIIIEVKQQDAIRAIDNPEIGPTSENALILAKDDFNIVSGTSADARGQSSDRETATQSKIVDMRAQIRESSDQMDFSTWLGLIARRILVTAQERLESGLWMKYTQNPGLDENFIQSLTQELQQGAQPNDIIQKLATSLQMQASQMPVFKWITSQHLDDGYDFEVEFDVQNATPAAMQASQQSFTNFMTLLQNFQIIGTNPALIREAAYRVGYRNEGIIQQVQKAAELQMKMQAAQQAAQISGQGSNGAGPQNSARTQAAQMATPPTSLINKQVENQLQ